MDLRHLRTFVMLADELHFGRAASRLNTSQPVVSRTLKELEAEIGTSLMRRSARKVELTSAGRLFLGRARAALENVAAGTKAARAGSDRGLDRVRLGMLIGAAQPFAGGLVTALKTAHPGIRVELVTLTERTPVAALTERDVDAAISSVDCLPAGLPRQEVGRLPLRIFMRVGHPLMERQAVEFEEFSKVPLVLPNPDAHPMMHDLIRTTMRHRGVEPEVAAVADDVLQMLALAEAGPAVAVLPAREDFMLPGLAHRPLIPTTGTLFFLTWKGTSRVVDAIRTAAPTASDK